MKGNIIIFLFCFCSVVSVFSSGKKDENIEATNNAPVINPQKKVEGLSVNNGRLSIDGDKWDIAFSLSPDKSMKNLEEAETYTHSRITRPDGPIDMMELMKGDDLICWVGDGIRADMGPAGLKVFPDEGVDKIKVQTDGKSWDVSLKKETPIIWNDREYIVFVSRIRKGTMQDQPEFAVDLVIMLK